MNTSLSRSAALAIAALSTVSAGLASCGPVDPCGSQSGACVALVLTGSVGKLDTAQFEMSGAVAHRFSSKFPGGPAALPVAVPVLVPESATGALTVVALGLQGGSVTAIGQAQVTLAAGGRARLEIPMAAASGASCSDKALDGSESDVDCGGKCPACDLGRACKSGADCVTGVCGPNKKCVKPICTDQAKNGDETDVDCGGSCPPCGDGQMCAARADCRSGVCDQTMKTCSSSSCTDTVKNGTETDVDCGGDCPACDSGKSCLRREDCVSLVCDMEMCQAPSCMDLVKNGVETDVDCGGGVCARCDDKRACKLPSDCKSGVCDAGQGACAPPTCGDAVKNGNETDVDCGGPDCKPCVTGKGCNVGKDCRDGVCFNSACQAPTCSDRVKNANETDVDCGGGVCAKCGSGKGCLINTDCLSGTCNAFVCK